MKTASLKKHSLAVVGSGPAGLMAATVLAQAGHAVEIFDANRGPARKLLIAGKSGLNIAYNAETDSLVSFYDGPKAFFTKTLQSFSRTDWLEFLHKMGIATFTGPTGRQFVKGLKAAPLLKAWLRQLKTKGVQLQYQKSLMDFCSVSHGVELTFQSGEKRRYAAAILALGGASWLAKNQPCTWPEMFAHKGIQITPLKSANAGFCVDWSADFLKEAEGLPLKNITLTSSNGTEAGELIITRYGLEGTPVYNLQKPQTVFLDLKPDVTVADLLKRIKANRENFAPLRLAKKHLNLDAARLALLFHHAPKQALSEAATLCEILKRFPLTLTAQQSLESAISTAGGVAFSEVDSGLQLKTCPGLFLAGEMLDWSAPTGGFLIPACVSQGHWAAHAALAYLQKSVR